jgi:7-carboxy-7-deazaguanine synthase
LATEQAVSTQELATGIRGFLYEVFSGIQGEGLLVGERQIFVRFSGCDLHCAYCDTPGAHERTNICLVEQTPGLRDFGIAQNPMTCGEAVSYVERLETAPGLHHSVALTGGEPLTQSRFVGIVARELKGRGLRVFLETNGELADRLPDVLPYVDIVSMDIKLPSATGCPDLLIQHERFLRIAAEKDVQVKIVMTSTTSVDELLKAVEMVRSVDAGIPLVLQPVTQHGKITPPSPQQMLDFQARCKGLLPNVRVIPQCHKIMKQR